MKADYYPPNSRVCVAAPDDRTDPFRGWVGTVDWTANDGGAMVHRVRFDDGNSSWYYAEELRAAQANNRQRRG